MNYRIFLNILVQSDSEYHPECMKSSFCWNNKWFPYLITQKTWKSLSPHLPSLPPPPTSELLWWMCLLECVNPKYPILRVHSSCRFKTFSPSAMGTRCHSVLGLCIKLRMKWSGFFWSQFWELSHNLANQCKNSTKGFQPRCYPHWWRCSTLDYLFCWSWVFCPHPHPHCR